MSIIDTIKNGVKNILGMGDQPDQNKPAVTGSAGPLDDQAAKLWRRRLERAKNHHQRYWDVADKIRAHYLGTWDAEIKDDAFGPVGANPLNMVASFVHTVSPLLLPDSVWPIVDHRRPSDEYKTGAKLLEARERMVFDTENSHRELSRAVLDSLWLQGFVITDWNPASSRKVVVQDQGTDTPVNVDLDDAHARNTVDADPDSPQLRWIPFKQIRRDPDALSHNKCRWIAYVEAPLLSEVQADDISKSPDGIYENTEELKEGGADMPENDRWQGKDYGDRPKEDRQINVYTIMQKGRTKGELELIVLAGPNYKCIRHVFVNFGISGWPIRCLELVDVGRLFPASPEQFWMDQVLAVNEFLAEIADRAREAKNLTLVQKGPENLKNQLENAKGGSIIEVASIKEGAMNVSVGAPHPESYKNAEMQIEHLKEISALWDFQKSGDTEKSGITATQIQSQDNWTHSRLNNWHNKINWFLRGVAEDVAGMLLRFQWQDVPVKVDQGGQTDYQTFNNKTVPPQLSAYDFDIDVSEHLRNSPQKQSENADKLFEMASSPEVVQALAAQGKQINIVAVLEKKLDALGERDLERFIQDLPPPPPAEGQEKEKPPSTSINFKDLPVSGQAQLAAQAGLHLDPQQMANEQTAKATKEHTDNQLALASKRKPAVQSPPAAVQQ